MNTGPSVTSCRYWNTSTNHQPSYHMNSCTYNYFIITINLFWINTQMNKILCFNYFTTHIIRHTPPYILIITSTSGRPNQFLQPCIPDSHLHRYVCRYINYTFIAFSV